MKNPYIYIYKYIYIYIYMYVAAAKPRPQHMEMYRKFMSFRDFPPLENDIKKHIRVKFVSKPHLENRGKNSSSKTVHGIL